MLACQIFKIKSHFSETQQSPKSCLCVFCVFQCGGVNLRDTTLRQPRAVNLKTIVQRARAAQREVKERERERDIGEEEELRRERGGGF